MSSLPRLEDGGVLTGVKAQPMRTGPAARP